VDPGIARKRVEENLDLCPRLRKYSGSYPVLVGLSRKSFIGAITGRGPELRLAGTVAANAAAMARGARILRVHDVEEAVDLIRVMAAIDSRSGGRKG
jgi:dihydropteroate synthase